MGQFWATVDRYQLQRGLITKRELRILLMQHSATKISHSNKSQEPSYDSYLCKDICQKFEIALLGDVVDPRFEAWKDPWEK